MLVWVCLVENVCRHSGGGFCGKSRVKFSGDGLGSRFGRLSSTQGEAAIVGVGRSP